jgi:hypothetical protein
VSPENWTGAVLTGAIARRLSPFAYRLTGRRAWLLTTIVRGRLATARIAGADTEPAAAPGSVTLWSAATMSSARAVADEAETASTVATRAAIGHPRSR